MRWETSLRALDGDTVQTAGGERIRLIGINSPELRGRRGDAEPLAGAAKRNLEAYLETGERFGLLPGADARDRYGRTLAHVRRDPGWDLSALQLSRGLAMQVVVGRNQMHADCYHRREQAARGAGLGVWSEPKFRARPASGLTGTDAGFLRLRGQVRTVGQTRGAYWMELDGPVVIRLPRNSLPSGVDPAQWVSRRVESRGWLVDRRDARAVRERGYARFLLRVDHPLLLEWLP